MAKIYLHLIEWRQKRTSHTLVFLTHLNPEAYRNPVGGVNAPREYG